MTRWVVDLLLALILLGNAAGGLRKGLILQVFSVLGIVAGIALGLSLLPQVVPLFHFLPEEVMVLKQVLAFLLIFVATVLVANVAGITLRGLVRSLFLGPIDRIGGALLAFLETWILVGGVFAFLLRHHYLSNITEASVLGRMAAYHVEILLHLLGF